MHHLRIAFHVSRLTSRVSRFTFHVSRLASRVSRLAFHVSRLASHVSRFTFHVSRFTSHDLPSRVLHQRLVSFQVALRNGEQVHAIVPVSLLKQGALVK